MDRRTYDEYLAKFNARDYRGVLDYYADEFELTFAGITLRSAGELLRFYSFLHSYLNESITIENFASNDHLVAIEATVRLEGRRDLSAEALADAGYNPLLPLRATQVIEIPQFIHYHLVDGKFVKAVCLVI